jgi:DNA repair protein RadC
LNVKSGDPNPSKNDEVSTENLIAILASLNIILVDHIILTHDSYYSFKDAGLLIDYRKTG